ncbi:hypothetical protein [Treponema sp. J25]|uniref:hypothetical protein n=1 Tax=Treponema sp. J25 TaxID=2094121 RepID=UPI00104DDBF0|nr:hypothetical protein [Treponema sp. J25]TCW60081.1 hypothetical protein C5O22_13465 [Treponema sp. J25]
MSKNAATFRRPCGLRSHIFTPEDARRELTLYLPAACRVGRGLSEYILTTLLFGFGLLASSCWHPPFDPAVSASAWAVEKLGNPVAEYTLYGAYGTANGFFWPAKDGTTFYLNTGLWVWEENNRLRIGYLSSLASGMVVGNSFFSELPFYKGERPWLLQYGANGMVYGGDPQNLRIVQAIPNDPCNQYIPSVDGSFISIGFGSLMNSTDNVEQVYIASWWRNTSGNPGIDVYAYKAGDSFPPSNPTKYTLRPPRELPEGSFWVGKYPYDENTAGPVYVSYQVRGTGTFVTYKWNDSGNSSEDPYKLPIPNRITRILSTGDLVAELDTKMFVYSPEGNLKYVIPTGSCRFIHEVWVNDGLGGGGHPEMLFSRLIRWKLSSWEQQQYGAYWKYQVSLYRIPTAELYRLAE